MPGLALGLYIVFYDLFRPIEGIFFQQIIVANASFSRKKLFKIMEFWVGRINGYRDSGEFSREQRLYRPNPF